MARRRQGVVLPRRRQPHHHGRGHPPLGGRRPGRDTAAAVYSVNCACRWLHADFLRGEGGRSTVPCAGADATAIESVERRRELAFGEALATHTGSVPDIPRTLALQWPQS